MNIELTEDDAAALLIGREVLGVQPLAQEPIPACDDPSCPPPRPTAAVVTGAPGYEVQLCANVDEATDRAEEMAGLNPGIEFLVVSLVCLVRSQSDPVVEYDYL